jgi:uncharacterized membrane protein
MLVDHCSYYLNSTLEFLDPLDPLFANWGQVVLRYVSYLCAPGFLLINGAMVWWFYYRRKNKGMSNWAIRKHLIQRGLFLILLQMTWVNSSWSGFNRFDPWHLGIIACIGFSMIFQSLIVNWRWELQLAVAVFILLLHPILIKIPYSPGDNLPTVFMQTFIDAGDFNKYPVIPWFAVALLGSVMAHGWLKAWDTDRRRIYWGTIIGASAIIVSIIIRMLRGYGNIFPFSDFGSYSFFFDQKYPPSLYFILWFFGWSILVISLFIAFNKYFKRMFMVLDITGKVALFFYCMHIAILGIFSKRIGIYYHELDIAGTLIGVVIMMVIMVPLSKWFYKIKSRSKNFIIRMM